MKEIRKEKQIYIFGAHSRAQTLGVYLSSLYPEMVIKAYLMDNDEDNPSEVDGVEVIDTREAYPDHLNADGLSEQINIDLPVYIATRGIYHDGIKNRLETLGFKKIIPVTPQLDNELRNKFMKVRFREDGRDFIKLGSEEVRKKSVCVYAARSVYDSKIKSEPRLKKYEKYIQAGTALTEERVCNCDIHDNNGENISLRNRQLCELTALYWIWKNAKEDILGLEHYRRRFILGDNWTDAFIRDDADVILPVPLYVHPSLAENYRKRHTKSTWEVMMSVLKRRDVGLYLKAHDFFENTGCYSPCNMLIARREVLDELCGWLFPILFETAGQIGTLEDAYQNRYPGFLSERLITFFFYLHRKKYTAVYADKSFIQ